MTVRSITVQIRAPSERDVGQVAEGFYVVAGSVLTMTEYDGEPILDIHRKPRTHLLRPEDNVDAIARVLLRKIRREILGSAEERRPLEYEPMGIA